MSESNAATDTLVTPDGAGLLRLAVRLDAVASGALGGVSVGAAGWLDDLLGAPAAALRLVGIFLVGYAVALWALASRPRLSRPAVWAVILGNLGWVAGSVALAVFHPVALTGLGTALVLVQAAAVALLADLQFVGLRRARR